ncbi:hypothetical protein [Gemmiger formicilis]|jgi:hypothetical protein|uniref:hypothetical protein n=1 Tax=Gemmiger formicilis TaxID=745368 RepID=UPI0035216CF4
MAENTIIHEISLAGYKATSTGGMLDLGTWGSYGIEKLHLTLDAAWQDLTITAFFNVNGKVVAKRVVGKDGYADVPWEATKENTFAGCLAFEGSINGQRRISTNLNYKVTNHSETTDSDPVPTDDRWNQFVTETKGYRDGAFEAAEKANARAEDAETASEDAQAAARAAKASENAAAASASNAAADAAKAGPYAEAARAAQEAAESARDKAIAAQQAAENAAAAAADSKSAADTLAAEAARAALAAENSKAAANNAANLAGENATAAQQAAATATAAANDAGQSASDAAASKAAAETAAKAAQDAQTATAAAKAEAVKAQEAAQTAAKSAQDAQAASENVRDDAQTAQQGAEAARDAAAKSAEAAAKSEANVKQSADTLAESVKNITPDDSSIGDKPWSSKHIIDMLCPPLEESGNPVVCYPVAGYSLGVKASWEPVQEGSGTPYPAGGGKQLLDTNKCVPTVGKPYGMTISLDGDVFKVSGVPNEEVTATEFYSFAVCTCSQEELRGKGYKVTAWAIKGKVNNAWGLRTESENSLAIAAELTPGVNNDIQLRLMVSKDNPTAWEPYENIRPIKGRDSVRVERCGENLLNIKPFNKDTYKGITYEYVPDGGIHVSGTALTSVDSPTFPVWLLPPGKYFGLELGSGISASIVVQRNGKNLWLNAKGAFEILAGDVTKYWYAIVSAGATVDKTVYPYIVPGTAAPTTYTPYTGQTTALTLPETVYGSEVDAVTGEGQETQKLVILNGTESWNSWGINAHNPAITGFYTYDINDYDAINSKGICSHLETPNQDVWGGRNAGIGFATVGSSRYFMFSMMTSSLPDISAGHEVASLKAYLAAQNDAGTPVQIAYKLAEPIPFTATGAQPLPALAGVNTVLTDADSATVTGRADPIKRTTDLEDAVASQT